MLFREKQRMRKNTKVHKLAEEVLCKCESEEFSMADLKDFARTLQAMIDKTLLLNEENHKLMYRHLTAEVFQNNNADTHQQSLENHHQHNEKILIKNGFVHCDHCKKIIFQSDKYCQYCGKPTGTKIS